MRGNRTLLHILWDDSEIWGLIAARAARAMGLPYRLARARDIASGLLERERPSLLLTPGGNARHKAESLGPAGLAALKKYVAGGGRYLGFCGGAGLALSWEQPLCSGMGICPWKRGRFDERMQHFMSGHLHAALPQGEGAGFLTPASLPASPRLPVWWPGRFAEKSHSSVRVLAAYERPADDFWLADLPIAELPPDIFTDWNNVYGLSLTPGFLEGQPCVIYGEHGKGAYVLSYSHLETPDSPHANAWLAHLFRELGGLEPSCDRLPPWRDEAPAWDDPGLEAMARQLEEVLETGLRHGLLFARTDWLLGWRYGLPGANLNNLWAALRAIREREPAPAALVFWRRHGADMRAAMDIFVKGCAQYLLAERLGMTLARALPEALPPGMLKDQREMLFGPPMRAGGLYRDLMRALDELAWLQMDAI